MRELHFDKILDSFEMNAEPRQKNIENVKNCHSYPTLYNKIGESNFHSI